MLALSAGVCLVATLLFGLVPAMLTSNIDLAGALRSQSGGVVGARGRAWVRSTLVLVQVSLSFVLLVGAGLLIQSLQAVRSASPGFSTRDVLTTGVDLFTAGYDAQRAKTFQDELVDRLQALGGVQSAAFSRMTPFSYRKLFDGADRRGRVRGAARRAADGGLQRSRPGVPRDDRHPARVGPRIHARRQRNGAAGRGGQRDDGGAVLARRGSGRPARAGERAVDAGRRRGAKAKYRNLLETPKPFFYVPLRQNFSADSLADPDTAGPGRDGAGAGARDPRARREPGAVGADHHARAGGSHDGVAEDLRSRSLWCSAGSRWCSRRSDCTG